MIINNTTYDYSMTLVLASISNDAVIVCADGIGLDQKTNKIVLTNAKKIFHIKDTLYWGAAAAYIHENELEHLNLYLTEAFKYVIPPYTSEMVAQVFITKLQQWFSVNGDGNQWVQAVIVGHDSNGKPFIYTSDSKDSYTAKSKTRCALGQIQREEVAEFTGLKNTTEELVTNMNKIIRSTSDKELSVGGDIRTVIIRVNNVEETIQEAN